MVADGLNERIEKVLKDSLGAVVRECEKRKARFKRLCPATSTLFCNLFGSSALSCTPSCERPDFSNPMDTSASLATVQSQVNVWRRRTHALRLPPLNLVSV